MTKKIYLLQDSQGMPEIVENSTPTRDKFIWQSFDFNPGEWGEEKFGPNPPPFEIRMRNNYGVDLKTVIEESSPTPQEVTIGGVPYLVFDSVSVTIKQKPAEQVRVEFKRKIGNKHVRFPNRGLKYDVVMKDASNNEKILDPRIRPRGRGK